MDSVRCGRWLRRGAIGAIGVAAIVALLGGWAWWTMLRMPGTSYHDELPATDAALRSLEDELRQDVHRLADEIGERNVAQSPRQLARAADAIESQFNAAGYTVARQRYAVDGTACFNLEVELRGTARPEEIVVVGAHYDTAVGTPGANDNTSGVAGTLALARRMARSQPGRTLRFVAFVNEEPPYFQTDQMGSRVYARRCRERNENVVAMLSLEMLGYYDDSPGSQHYPRPFNWIYPSTGNFIAFIGNTASRSLVRDALATFRAGEQFPSEGIALPSLVRSAGFSDQWSFWQEGYQALMVTDTAMFRYRHYHEPEDTSEKIDFNRMARVVRGLVKVVETLADVKHAD